MPNDNFSSAITEAYANAPADIVTLDTISLSHPLWQDESGDAVALYFVRDYVAIVAGIEDTATIDAGQMVTFQPYAFDIVLPEIKTTQVPSVRVTIDNVGGEIVPYLDQAAGSRDKVTLIYRPYLSNDLAHPQLTHPLELTLSDISLDSYRIQTTAKIADLDKKAFPNKIYKLDTFPSLANFP